MVPSPVATVPLVGFHVAITHGEDHQLFKLIYTRLNKLPLPFLLRTNSPRSIQVCLRCLGAQLKELRERHVDRVLQFTLCDERVGGSFSEVQERLSTFIVERPGKVFHGLLKAILVGRFGEVIYCFGNLFSLCGGLHELVAQLLRFLTGFIQRPSGSRVGLFKLAEAIHDRIDEGCCSSENPYGTQERQEGGRKADEATDEYCDWACSRSDSGDGYTKAQCGLIHACHTPDQVGEPVGHVFSPLEQTRLCDRNGEPLKGGAQFNHCAFEAFHLLLSNFGGSAGAVLKLAREGGQGVRSLLDECSHCGTGTLAEEDHHVAGVRAADLKLLDNLGHAAEAAVRVVHVQAKPVDNVLHLPSRVQQPCEGTTQ